MGKLLLNGCKILYNEFTKELQYVTDGIRLILYHNYHLKSDLKFILKLTDYERKDTLLDPTDFNNSGDNVYDYVFI